MQQIREIAGVSYAHKVDKTYDLVVKVESDSIEKFTFAIRQIRQIDGLMNTDTMIGFQE